MKLHISVRSSDPNVISQIAQMRIEEVTVKQSRTIKEIVNPPVDFLLEFGANVAAQLIALKLYDILKNKKETKLRIENQPVPIISIQIIEQQINYALEREKGT